MLGLVEKIKFRIAAKYSLNVAKSLKYILNNIVFNYANIRILIFALVRHKNGICLLKKSLYIAALPSSDRANRNIIICLDYALRLIFFFGK